VSPVNAQTATRHSLNDAESCALARSMNERPARFAQLLCEPQALTKSPSTLHPEWFLAYQLVAPDTIGGASFNRGFYAVNRITGDTWELILCTSKWMPRT
jgi:hypothetical protein